MKVEMRDGEDSFLQENAPSSSLRASSSILAKTLWAGGIPVPQPGSEETCGAGRKGQWLSVPVNVSRSSS